MSSLKAFVFLTIALSAAAFASSEGGAHHGSVSDLIAPAVNVLVLVGFLVWKLKTPLKNHFDTKSTEISNTLERASLKAKEAKIMLETQERKMANLSNELKLIQSQADSDGVHFEKIIAKDIEEKTHKLKIDANSKILSDKKSAMDDLNAELLDQVIKKTKSSIKNNKDYQSKVSTKLLQGL
jgi:F0F1-type ATP synthase membrane subunit b/b'